MATDERSNKDKDEKPPPLQPSKHDMQRAKREYAKKHGKSAQEMDTLRPDESAGVSALAWWYALLRFLTGDPDNELDG